jgi:hypothetical protein
MAIWSKIKTGVLVALAFVGVLIGVWFGGRRSGTVSEQFQRKKDELQAEKEENQQHIDTRKEMNDAQDTTNSLPPGDANRRLRDGWMRDERDEQRP